ncbi:hypothetical protein P171DRAFT_243648 [Karstenula rhodostoma CBS 690.94]|uniref:Uncharacterized protein n=1 Tax=Karstenula rhodostoma CBS 690.94 TaxID=1392251 RepID=A0A9P4PL02_9PLEO|nr:hypothetical protein P171DRAFT_243648 [Karstenula rhodostoma CBS 690.94]
MHMGQTYRAAQYTGDAIIFTSLCCKCLRLIRVRDAQEIVYRQIRRRHLGPAISPQAITLLVISGMASSNRNPNIRNAGTLELYKQVLRNTPPSAPLHELQHTQYIHPALPPIMRPGSPHARFSAASMHDSGLPGVSGPHDRPSSDVWAPASTLNRCFRHVRLRRVIEALVPIAQDDGQDAG